MVKNLLILLLFVCQLGRAYAGNIKGIITDEKNEAIPFASVFVAGTTMGTTSNESGFYMLLLKPGKYTISVKSIGYTVVSKEIVVDDEEQQINFKLKEETINIKEFTVN
jgi:hypothetical protein